MEDKYKIINESLNKYCKKIDDTFYMYNLDFFFNITLEVLSILEKYDTVYSSETTRIFYILNPEFDQNKIFLSGIDSVEIVKNYLKEKMPQYLKEFNDCLSNGTFRFVDKKEAPEERSYADLNDDNHPVINVALNHDYSDPSTIIHEFFHHLNRGVENEIIISRNLLTEGVSIFFETDLYNYMIKSGYDEEEIYKIRRFRINDCYEAGRLLLPEITLIDSYIKFGDISEKSFEDRQKYTSFGWVDKEDVTYSINKLLKDNKEYKFKYDKNIGYIFGTLIAYNGINSKNKEILEKFLKLNNSLGNKDVFECLNIIDIDLIDRETDYELYNSFIKEVKKINGKYKDNNLVKKYK